MHTRLAALRALMRETGTDLVVLGPGGNQQWLVGFHTYPDERPALMLIGLQEEAFVMPALNADEARQHAAFHYEIWSDADGPDAALSTALRLVSPPAGIKRYALDETMRTDFSFLVMRHLSDAQASLSTHTIGQLRMRKTEEEYRLITENAAIADKAMNNVLATIRPGVPEKELARIAQSTFAENGAETLFTMIVSGPNSAMPHCVSGERVLQDGDVIIIDIGGKKSGYCSDITRMAIVGEPDAEFFPALETVERAVQAALAAAKPGVKASAIDHAARKVIADAGYGKYFLHRTGHGLGSEVHEHPFIDGASKTVLEEGMVFSIEPGIYLLGKFGIRLEEIVILRADGPEVLSSIPRDAIRFIGSSPKQPSVS